MDKILPNALMIGVNYDLFWTLNPKSLQPFIKAFDLKRKYDDEIAWRNGMYVKMAIASSLSKENKYPERPITMKDVVIEVPQEVIMERFLRHVELLNSRF